jgi:hypothetical protein
MEGCLFGFFEGVREERGWEDDDDCTAGPHIQMRP